MNYIVNPKGAHIFVIGNEKGGAGKTTTAMHLITMLLSLGFKIASIDVDVRQKSLSRYLEYRAENNDKYSLELLMPTHYTFEEVKHENLLEKNNIEKENFEGIIKNIQSQFDFIIIDTPGTHNFLSALAHSYADTIITPLNDSFVDFDLLAKVSASDLEIISPALYSQMVWEQKMVRAKRDGGKINWLVMRNRLGSVNAKNKTNVEQTINKLAKRIGFSHIAGFNERVIFRELFLQGLTLIDIIDKKTKISLSLSHIAARAELRDFMNNLGIEKISEALKKSSHKNFKEKVKATA